MPWWIKWFVVGSLTAWVGLYRHWTFQLIRTRTAGSFRIATSLTNNTDSYQFFDSSSQAKSGYFEFEDILYAEGLCGDLEVPPMQRPCTPPLHVHLNQTEFFTVIQGQMGFQLGDKVYSYDVHTCPQPLIISPLVPHTFWMADNKEDLIVRVRVERSDKDSGIGQEFFENLAGISRDQQTSFWQIALLFENAQVYPASLPLPLAKIIFKISAFIAQLLGYQSEYEEYTATTETFTN